MIVPVSNERFENGEAGLMAKSRHIASSRALAVSTKFRSLVFIDLRR